MYEKLKDSITKLKNTTIIAPLIHVYFNTYLLKAVFWLQNNRTYTKTRNCTEKAI